MREPSTTWREVVGDDEEQRFSQYAAQFAELQRRKSAKYGKGRVLHRKQVMPLLASLEVLPNLPAHAKHGLFARPATYDARIRLSNGAADRQADARPDIRGFALKVLGVEGKGALGGDTHEQDFLLINHARFSFPTSHEFVGLAVAASNGPLSLLSYLIGRYGFVGGLKKARELAGTVGKPFRGFAAEQFHSAAPIACGPYAVKVRLVPVGDPKPARDDIDWAEDVHTRLMSAPLKWNLQLQFFIDEALTPIEDASKEWPAWAAPFVTVARLTVPSQPVSNLLWNEVESAKFDPWNALVEHRPLGEVMRARKATYFTSQQGRGVA